MTVEFRGKVALISGGAGGVGLSVTRMLAEAGAHVVIVDLADHADDLASELVSSGQSAVAIRADVSDERQIQAAVDKAVALHGRIDILINHAGTVLVRRFLETSRSDWERLFAINLLSMVDMTRAVLPHMLGAGDGVIVNTASISGLTASPLEAAYCATKGACIQFTRAIAVEFRDRGIRCNAVCPGFIRTAHGLRELAAFEAEGEPLTESDVQRMQGRMCEPAEVATAILFLAGAGSAFINGEMLVVDNAALAAT
jgi:NAD(P)-dependent dehydrogenase (short-subunit alcohol dehydrogenase family)